MGKLVKFGPAGKEERPDDMPRFAPEWNADETTNARSTQSIQENRFGIVVSLMSRRDGSAIHFCPNSLKDLVPEFSGSLLLGETIRRGVKVSVDSLAMEWDAPLLGMVPHKCLVTHRLLTPQLMVDMRDDEIKMPLRSEPCEQLRHDHGVNATAHCQHNRATVTHESRCMQVVRECGLKRMMRLLCHMPLDREFLTPTSRIKNSGNAAYRVL